MSETRTLLWLHENFVSARQGGNSRATLGLAALLEAGWQVDLICTTRSYLGETYGDGEAVVEQDGGLRIHRLAAGPRTSRARQYIHFCREALRYAATLRRPDLIFTSSPSLPQVAPALWLASRHRLPLVLEVRDLWPAFLEQGGLLRSPLLLAAMRLLEDLAYRRADQVVAVSPAFSPYLHSMDIDELRLSIAPTGADPSLLNTTDTTGQDWRTRNGFEDAFLILYAGSFNSFYGVDLLVAAIDASAGQPIHWLLAGAGEEEEAIKACTQRNHHAHYLGLLPKTELLPAIAAADLGISIHAPWPLLETTLSGKLFDYLAAGTPILNLAPGLMAEVIQQAGSGWQCRRDPEELLEHITRIAAMPAADRSAIGRNGREWLRSNMHGSASARRVAASVEKAYTTPRADGLMEFASAVWGATLALVGDRSRHNLNALYGEMHRTETIQAALELFLDNPVGEPSRQLKVPELLGGTGLKGKQVKESEREDGY